MTMKLPLNVVYEEAFRRLLSHQSGKALKLTDYTLSVPQAVTGRTDGLNTKVTVTPAKGNPHLKGSPWDVHYMRRNFEEVFTVTKATKSMRTTLTPWLASDTKMIATQLNTKLGTALRATDITVVPGLIVLNQLAPTVKINANNLCLFGQVQLTILPL